MVETVKPEAEEDAEMLWLIATYSCQFTRSASENCLKEILIKK